MFNFPKKGNCPFSPIFQPYGKLKQKHFFFFNVKVIRPKAKARGDIKKISRNFSIIKSIFVME